MKGTRAASLLSQPEIQILVYSAYRLDDSLFLHSGTSASSLEALEKVPDFADVISLLDVQSEPTQVLSDLTEIFPRVYLANASAVLSTTVFIHSVTSVAALRSLVPFLLHSTVQDTLRCAWQAGCGLYVAFGKRPVLSGEIEPPRASRETLSAMALTKGDECVIQFTVACLREYDFNPSSSYLTAARHASSRLVPN